MCIRKYMNLLHCNCCKSAACLGLCCGHLQRGSQGLDIFVIYPWIWSQKLAETCSRSQWLQCNKFIHVFYVYGSVHRWSILIIVQRDATQSSLFIIMQVHSTCFGCQPHPSSGVHKTVTTASGTGHIFCAATSLQHGQAWPRWREVVAQYWRL